MTYWDGDSWETEPFPGGTSLLSEIEVRGSQIWAIAESDAFKDTLYYIDLSSGVADTIPLSESMLRSKVAPHQIRLQPDGSLLVYSVGDDQKRIDILHDNEWKAPGYTIETPDKKHIRGFSAAIHHRRGWLERHWTT